MSALHIPASRMAIGWWKDAQHHRRHEGEAFFLDLLFFLCAETNDRLHPLT